MSKDRPEGDTRQRIDKWLFFARIAKSRSVAQAKIFSNQVKLNGTVVSQPSRLVHPGDRLEIQGERGVLVLEIRQSGARRGPYEEARLLYEELASPDRPGERSSALDQAMRVAGSGRPTKKERRALDRVRQGEAFGEE